MRPVYTIRFITTAFFSFLLFFQPAFSQESPDSFFKKQIGNDGVLISYTEICRYLKHLEGTSSRIRLRDEGQSTLGMPMVLAIVSSEKNIDSLEHLMEVNQALARPDHLDNERIAFLLTEARIFILVTGTLHATEIAAAQMMVPFTHFLATTNDPHWLEILDKVVLLLMPSINPDGHAMVTDWYHKTKSTANEGSPLPFLYHHYAGHDNNRDYFMLNLKETRVVNQILHHRFFPQIFLDMHQMGGNGPRMFVPPFKDPINENLDPLLIREVNTLGSYMALKLQQAEKKGVASAYAFDAYWPGGSKNTAWYKNVVGLLTEIASTGLASPIHIDFNELDVRAKGLPEYKAQVNFPDPWTGGWWHLQDIIDYGRIAVEALLEMTSSHQKLFLQNYIAMGKNAIRLPAECGIYGYLIPQKDQWDKSSSRILIQKMMEHGVDVYQFRRQLEFPGMSAPCLPGDYYIPLTQPFGRFVKAIMEIQHYPTVKDGVAGDVVEPYDVAGWTLPLQMGVHCVALGEKPDADALQTIQGSDLQQEDTFDLEPGNYLLSGQENSSWFLINQLLKMKSSPSPSRVTSFSPLARAGDFVVSVIPGNRKKISNLLREHCLQLKSVDTEKLQIQPVHPKTIGLYQGSVPSMDEGWTRWVLDHYGFTYHSLKNTDFLSGDLPAAYDVILIPSINRDTILYGFNQKRYRSQIESIPLEYRNGIGEKGMAKLVQFVRKGKTLILLDASWEIASMDFALPVRNQLDGLSQSQCFIPGSLMNIRTDPRDPLCWGMPETTTLYFSHSPAFRTRPVQMPGVKRFVAGRFADSAPHLISGYAKGETYLDRAVTALRFQLNKGHLVLFAGRIQHRSQTFATFKMLFNALFL